MSDSAVQGEYLETVSSPPQAVKHSENRIELIFFIRNIRYKTVFNLLDSWFEFLCTHP